MYSTFAQPAPHVQYLPTVTTLMYSTFARSQHSCTVPSHGHSADISVRFSRDPRLREGIGAEVRAEVRMLTHAAQLIHSDALTQVLREVLPEKAGFF